MALQPTSSLVGHHLPLFPAPPLLELSWHLSQSLSTLAMTLSLYTRCSLHWTFFPQMMYGHPHHASQAFVLNGYSSPTFWDLCLYSGTADLHNFFLMTF